MLVCAPIVFLVLFWISAPYGRHERQGWGPEVASRYGWLLMEAPASLIMLVPFFLLPINLGTYVLLFVWQIHYFHRAFIYPFTLKTSNRMPWAVVLMAITFNAANGFLNGWHFVLHADWYDGNWLYRPNFIAGAMLFAIGFFITKRSDAILGGLRVDTGDGYQIPQGFLYRWVSCPNYLGECIQWFGWGLMTLSPAGWLFFFWTLANLVPRAVSHQRWYRETFEDYPTERKAIIPFLF
ncbi:MAG: 3-oxo-5-alpha-steroid 4-dehydrogenase [Gammaproteobacteria bacterium]|jgi:3-oxo-5-alpha-steroid 4-dehydrogenase 1|nr:3-oxo-5-alpha-steroid 4-dehydrogenase [Gammaproteobacteria bacterium]MBT7371947.1 3-oxo-5-alpha-steroid 4-dehydrogenase [Gammaproteobacteria bacterium]